jgi:hypothetical protein
LIKSGGVRTTGRKPNGGRNGFLNTLLKRLFLKNQRFLNAWSVDDKGRQKVGLGGNFAQGNVRLVGTQEIGEKRPVYNLSVENNHEYFANNILVSNCHATAYYLIASGRSGIEGAVFMERRFKGRESYFVDSSGKIPAISIEEIANEKPKADWRYPK